MAYLTNGPASGADGVVPEPQRCPQRSAARPPSAARLSRGGAPWHPPLLPSALQARGEAQAIRNKATADAKSVAEIARAVASHHENPTKYLLARGCGNHTNVSCGAQFWAANPIFPRDFSCL